MIGPNGWQYKVVDAKREVVVDQLKRMKSV